MSCRTRVNCGLSPRVRGNPSAQRDAPGQRGSIPACAGEPLSASRTIRKSSVYPRVCGGTQHVPHCRRNRGGLSPRVRGNPLHSLLSQPKPGSIPACAGEPCRSCVAWDDAGVYPRVCGGTGWRVRLRGGHRGLSPRVRGNRVAIRCRLPMRRSIPACAGELTGKASGGVKGVYPRVCGGTEPRLGLFLGVEGLSPRVRGNRSPISRREGT